MRELMVRQSLLARGRCSGAVPHSLALATVISVDLGWPWMTDERIRDARVESRLPCPSSYGRYEVILPERSVTRAFATSRTARWLVMHLAAAFSKGDFQTCVKAA